MFMFIGKLLVCYKVVTYMCSVVSIVILLILTPICVLRLALYLSSDKQIIIWIGGSSKDCITHDRKDQIYNLLGEGLAVVP